MSKEDSTVITRSVDYFIAQARWTVFWEKQGGPIPSFANFCGMSKDPLKYRASSDYEYDVYIRDSAARKVKLLSGPNWYAILKAYQIKKYPNDERNETRNHS